MDFGDRMSEQRSSCWSNISQISHCPARLMSYWGGLFISGLKCWGLAIGTSLSLLRTAVTSFPLPRLLPSPSSPVKSSAYAPSLGCYSPPSRTHLLLSTYGYRAPRDPQGLGMRILRAPCPRAEVVVYWSSFFYTCPPNSEQDFFEGPL